MYRVFAPHSGPSGLLPVGGLPARGRGRRSLRRADLRSSSIVHVDYARVLGFANLAQDLPLLPKDVIFVPWRGHRRDTHMEPILSYVQRDIPLRGLVKLLEKLGP